MTQTSLNQPKSTVSNTEIEAYLSMQETRKSLKSRLELMEQAVDKAEAEILAKIDAGADLMGCGYSIVVNVTERRNVRWKEEFLSRCGKAEADLVTNATTPTRYRRLVIAQGTVL